MHGSETGNHAHVRGLTHAPSGENADTMPLQTAVKLAISLGTNFVRANLGVLWGNFWKREVILYLLRHLLYFWPEHPELHMLTGNR